MSLLRQFTHLAVMLIAILLIFSQIQLASAEFDCNTVSEIPISECEALVSLFNSTGGDAWVNSSGWIISHTPCSWYGVECNDGHVTSLILFDNNAIGSIPSELKNLSNLWRLFLSDNQLTGSIPPELGNLSNLSFLGLQGNQLDGNIPPELGNLSNLQMLRLYSNQLIGSIPLELGNLSNLKKLELNNNELVGKIPKQLMNLTNLEWLNICDNHLYTNDPDLRDFLISKYGNWERCQTPPFFIAMPWILLPLLND